MASMEEFFKLINDGIANYARCKPKILKERQKKTLIQRFKNEKFDKYYAEYCELHNEDILNEDDIEYDIDMKINYTSNPVFHFLVHCQDEDVVDTLENYITIPILKVSFLYACSLGLEVNFENFEEQDIEFLVIGLILASKSPNKKLLERYIKQSFFDEIRDGLPEILNEMNTNGDEIKVIERDNGEQKDICVVNVKNVESKKQKEFVEMKRANSPKIKSPSPKTKSPSPKAKSPSPKTKYECGCCYDEFPASDMLTCSHDKNHKICPDCIKGFINAGLDEGVTNNVCIMNATFKCGGHYRDDELFAFLPQDVAMRFFELKDANDALCPNSILENYHTCPFCNRYGVEVDDKNLFNINCPRCDKNWCIKCNHESHPDTKCGVITLDIDEDAEAKIRKEVTDTITNAVLKRCPNCNRTYQKDGGCNKMTCSGCGKCSCYLCGVLLNGYNNVNGTPHFGQAPKCKLFNDNVDSFGNDDKYSKKKIDEALKELLDKQTDKRVIDIMKKEIEFQANIKVTNEQPMIFGVPYAIGAPFQYNPMPRPVNDYHVDGIRFALFGGQQNNALPVVNNALPVVNNNIPVNNARRLNNALPIVVNNNARPVNNARRLNGVLQVVNNIPPQPLPVNNAREINNARPLNNIPPQPPRRNVQIFDEEDDEDDELQAVLERSLRIK